MGEVDGSRFEGARGLRVAYLCLQPTVKGQGSRTHVHGIVDGLRALGASVTLVEPSPSVAFGGLVRRLGSFLRVQLDVVRHADIDALYVRMHPVALPSVWWGRLGRRRVVVEVNGPAEDWVAAWPQLRRVSGVLRLLLSAQLRAADAVVTVTPGLASWVRSFAGREGPVEVIPNGVDVHQFRPDASGAPSGLPPRYAVFVGALAPWQGVADLVGARMDREWPTGVELVVAGDGVERGLLEASPILHLAGVPSAQIPGLLAGAVAALVPSRDRAGTGVAPLKLFEAMAAGVPVVAADVAESNRLAHGLLVAPGDVRGWARAVARLVDDPALAARLGAAGRTAAVEQHSWAARAAATAEVLACAS